MATITTNIPTVVQLRPLQGPGDIQRRLSGIPRALVYSKVAGDQINDPGVGNNQAFICDTTLDPGFTYFVWDHFVKIEGLAPAVHNWNLELRCSWGDETVTPGQPLHEYTLVSRNTYQIDTNLVGRLYKPDGQLPVSIDRGVDPSGRQLRVEAYNDIADDIDYLYTMLITLLQYDEGQAYIAPLNAPALIRG